MSHARRINRQRSCGRRCAWPALLTARSVCAAILALDNADCFTCHEDKSADQEGRGREDDPALRGSGGLPRLRSWQQLCTSCHPDITEVPHPDGFKAKPAQLRGVPREGGALLRGQHPRAGAPRGKPEAAACADCHGKHDILPLSAPTSPLNHEHLGATCGKCHPQIMEDVRNSIHGKAMAQGLRDAPTCTDCHADHQIEGFKKASPDEDRRGCLQPLPRLGALQRPLQPAHRPRHDLLRQLPRHGGQVRLRPAAPTAPAATATTTCCPRRIRARRSTRPTWSGPAGNAIPGPTRIFASAPIHLDEASTSDIGSRINWWVRRIYLLLIWGVIGGMLAHNFLVLRKKFAARAARRTARWCA